METGAIRRAFWLGAGAVCCLGVAGLGAIAGLLGSRWFLLVTLVALGGSVACWWAAMRPARELAKAEAPVPPGRYDEVTRAQRGIAAAFEIERRRIERDLHDGAQQYLVAASMDVGEASLLLDGGPNGVTDADLASARERMNSAQDRAELALRALRQTVAGIHPKVLSDLGLEPAVRDLVELSPLDVTLHVPHPLPTVPEGVTAAGYFMVAEALTNAAKYAPGARATVLLASSDTLTLAVSDDGPGGAHLRPDGGLAGIAERLGAFGGRLEVVSPPGGPTTVTGRIPLLLNRGEFGVSGDVPQIASELTTQGAGAQDRTDLGRPEGEIDR
ncbi:sensor histidine kinase [Nigerium massiliense]|uniref:sensor histidine kinase n=1 Tax=Nigerium massiliense TaxID=1522317 RepID=UPI000907C96A|nr:histidine kinase [Nigerium massiliense]